MSDFQKQHQVSISQPTKKTVPLKGLQTNVSADHLRESPETMNTDEMLNAQQQVGNQVVQRALDQTNKNQSKEGLSQEFTDQVKQKRGSGMSLPKNIQSEVGKKLGHKLDGVQIHTDATADKLSRSINARAFTLGKDIFFKGGVFSPESSKGRETIIHELTHVVQQSNGNGGVGKIKLGAPDTSQEKEADKVGKQLANSVLTTPVSTKGTLAQAQFESGMVVQRAEVEEEEPLQMQPENINLVQRSGLDEEELQMQPEYSSVIQREAPEEDELQMQPDASARIQRETSEEDVLQMQPDTLPLIQRQTPEEEELQMQSDPGHLVQREGPEEEELQMQPDTTNTIQRDLQEELQKERLRRLQTGGRKKRNESIKKIEAKNEKNALNKEVFKSAKSSQESSAKKAEELTAKSKDMGIGSKKNIKNIDKLESDRDKKNKKMMANQYSSEKEDRHTKSRNDLMNTIRNKKSSTEDVKSAQEQLDMMHKRGKMDTLKSFFKPGATTKSYSEQALGDRKKVLKESAKSGDKDAFSKYKEEKTERTKNSNWTKFKGGVGKAAGGVASGIGGLLSGYAKKQFGSLKDHYVGKSNEKESKSDPVEKEAKGSSGGTGINAIMEKYSELVIENKKLKDENEKLKNK